MPGEVASITTTNTIFNNAEGRIKHNYTTPVGGLVWWVFLATSLVIGERLQRHNSNNSNSKVVKDVGKMEENWCRAKVCENN